MGARLPSTDPTLRSVTPGPGNYDLLGKHRLDQPNAPSFGMGKGKRGSDINE